MRIFTLTLACALCGLVATAQEVGEKALPFAEVDQKAIYPGCDGETTEEARFNCMNLSLQRFVAKNLVYPREAVDKDIQGKVYVSFVIAETGDIVDVKAVRGVHPALDQAAIDVVSKLPKLRPALKDGQAVRMEYTMPISFNLAGSSKEKK
ncbi:TonB family protein [bacterium]|nr:TonB family protein [bacterium]